MNLSLYMLINLMFITKWCIVFSIVSIRHELRTICCYQIFKMLESASSKRLQHI